jgi:hypothetical protein
MSVPPVTRRRTSSDKNKHVSGHTGTKNGAHGRKNILTKSSSVDQTSVPSKSDTKKHSPTDTHTKSAQAGNTYKNTRPPFIHD